MVEFSDMCNELVVLKNNAPGPFFFLGDLHVLVIPLKQWELIMSLLSIIKVLSSREVDSGLWLYNGLRERRVL